MKKLEFGPEVTEVEKARQNLTSDNLLRKLSVYNRLHLVFAQKEGPSTIMPIILAQLPNDAHEVQIEAGKGLSRVLEKLKLPVDTNQEILNLTLAILNQWNQIVIDQWIEVFGRLLDLLEWTKIRSTLEELIVHLSKTSQPLQSRYAAAKLIPIMARKKGELIEGLIFDRAKQLCEDFEKSIRKLMASESILAIYAAVRSPIFTNILFEKIVELIYDPELEVKIEAIKMTVELLDYIKEEKKREKLVGIYIEQLNNVQLGIVQAFSEKLALIISKVSLKIFLWEKGF